MRTMVLSQVPPMECLREMLLKYPALIKLLVYISKHELKRLVINGYELEDDFGEDEIAYQIGETTEILSRGSLCTAPHCVRLLHLIGNPASVLSVQEDVRNWRYSDVFSVANSYQAIETDEVLLSCPDKQLGNAKVSFFGLDIVLQ
ncbi:uncharacterized protein LOC113306759 isoform X3 [Papaver somniferum]|uniref:uncharacterized protein LOC113306759 isoform X3 n=1 Tax=Papaver somniferum TaxID=3469 RepID=UPI000E70044E|nr:uncharacterized protein LOC113306759 isoform X3 [Papaver somniferum]XP_026411458.1 uncharacterized protein LOC113306759 isoform X3 [Papaver somniferum]